MDTACSSSMVAVHTACRSLHEGESDMALAGGVMLMLDQRLYASASGQGMLSPTGHCHAFDVAADGFVRSEGCAIVVLKRLPDADGRRTEIQCALCGAHLGHVFSGEKLTAKDTRHCVNSLSLHFIQATEAASLETAVFGGGCFWCGEAVFQRLRGVVSVLSGYAGGDKVNPTYEEVCGGATGHAEVVKIEFDPQSIGYEVLLEVFFAMHDPTTLNLQGNDVGSQYRSVIFYSSAAQQAVAARYIKRLAETREFPAPLVTALEPLSNFYPAGADHFDYYNQHGGQPYCRLVISPKIKKLQEKFKKILKTA